MVGWDGGALRPIFGATPLQALTLAAEFLPSLLKSHFPGCEFQSEGKPLFF
jgi:hypothetical protein